MVSVVSAFADNDYTAAGVDITNKGTLSFKVNGTDQDTIDSNEDTFKVDRKLDVFVLHKENDYIPVTPGSSEQNLTFTVRNDGNGNQDFKLTQVNNKGNPFEANHVDDSDVTFVKFCYDSTNDGKHDTCSADNAADYTLSDLAPDANLSVVLVYNIPSTLTNGNTADYALKAQIMIVGGAAETNTSGADRQTEEDNVLADVAGVDDGSQDGYHSDYHAFKVVSAVLNFRKWSIVTYDPINKDVDPKRIPGATIYYCFEVNNTGDANATDVYWTDDWTNNDGKLAFPDDSADDAVQDPVDITTGCNEDCSNITVDYGGSHSGKVIRLPSGSNTVRVDTNKSVCGSIKTTVL